MAETAQFPTSITSQLFDVVDRKSTTLTADITDSDTTIPVASLTGFPDAGFVTIDNETIYYSGKSVASGAGNLTGCTRGYSGTAVSHTSGTQVKLAIVAATINRINAEVVAVQNKIGISGSTVTTTIEYKLRNLNAVTQDGSTVVPNLNAQYLGGSTESQLNAGYLGGSTEGQLNVTYLGGSTKGEIVLNLGTTTTGTTITPARLSQYTQYSVTALATDPTIAVPSGAPQNGDRLVIRIEDNGTGRTLTWASGYQAKGVSLPTSTTAGKTLYVGFIYNSADSKWDCVASSEEG